MKAAYNQLQVLTFFSYASFVVNDDDDDDRSPMTLLLVVVCIDKACRQRDAVSVVQSCRYHCQWTTNNPRLQL